MSDFKGLSKIYIIESPNDNDILFKRNEGEALSKSLNLAGIKNEYFLVVSKEMFRFIIDQIAVDIYTKNRANELVIPYLHFSTHGDKDGIYLTDKTFISWENLRFYIDRINSKVGFISPPTHQDKNMSLLNICFSVCEGFNAREIQGDLKDNKYVFLVGPIIKVDWADSLIAFTTFYHQIFYKDKKALEAVKNMNSAAGLPDIFRISMGTGLILAKD